MITRHDRPGITDCSDQRGSERQSSTVPAAQTVSGVEAACTSAGEEHDRPTKKNTSAYVKNVRPGEMARRWSPDRQAEKARLADVAASLLRHDGVSRAGRSRAAAESQRAHGDARRSAPAAREFAPGSDSQMEAPEIGKSKRCACLETAEWVSYYGEHREFMQPLVALPTCRRSRHAKVVNSACQGAAARARSSLQFKLGIRRSRPLVSASRAERHAASTGKTHGRIRPRPLLNDRKLHDR